MCALSLEAFGRNVSADCTGMQGSKILMSSELLGNAEAVNEGPSVRKRR